MPATMEQQERVQLWYREPARVWPNALPIGNGRLGAMVWGQVRKERWQLNEDSVWYGGPRDRNPKDALKYLPTIRQLLDQGRLAEAERLWELAFIATPQSQRHYETLGQADLIFPHGEHEVSGYRRWLDLETATAGVSYDVGGVTFTREVLASHGAGVIAAQFTASTPGALNFDLRIIRQGGTPPHERGPGARPLRPEESDTNVYLDWVRPVNDDTLVMKAREGGGGVEICLAATVRIENGMSPSRHCACVKRVARGKERCLPDDFSPTGTLKVIGESIVVENADRATVILAAETTFRERDPQAACLETVARAAKIGYSQLRSSHILEHQALFSRADLRLGSLEARLSAQARPTNDLVADARAGKPDPWLISLYYLYGRYLLISCSRPGRLALPANLQGIWCEAMSPTWGSKYTININTEMNYWPACPTGLGECQEPLFDHIERLAVNGAVTAATMYACRGWCAHHNTDLWADSAPQDHCLTATMWPMGGAWLCTHIWTHYDYTGDIALLRRMYPVLRGCVEFFLDFLIERDGFKVTSPSLSPENLYRLANGEEGALCIAPTMDNVILTQLFSDFLAAADVVLPSEADDRDIRRRVREFRDKLPPLRIGRHGQLLEWREDHDEVEPGHRHVSHLWGLYPGEQITRHEPALIEASKVTLARRAASGGGHTGWSRAWMIALWARLGDGDEAGRHVAEILRTSTYDSLLDDHPPFQIDGNFGAAAGIAEMLVQSRRGGEIWLLAALPTSWSRGVARGLCARGGFVLDLLEWDASRGSLTGRCEIRSDRGRECVLGCGLPLVVRCRGETVARSTDSAVPVRFGTEKGMVYVVEFGLAGGSDS